MNLVIIAAFIAVCGAAKLDRGYLPPPSAKTAGGSPGELQAPKASFNNGLGGLPKGSYENDFQGVVVDAAAAGTRTAEAETGLGAPRVSYGSTDSKVGAAAFKTRPSALQAPQDAQDYQEAQGSFSSGAGFRGPQNSFTGNTQGFQSQGQNFAQNTETQQFSNPERARASIDRQASILRYENEVGPESYHYAFETDNGITAEENGVATNGVQAQGGFSYTGDDGQVYSISYTADEGGYQPKGDHLPTPPPIPPEILRSLEQNARDEAAGLIDDGSYDAQKYNAGSDYTESDNGNNGKYTHQSSKFGTQAVADLSGGSINQNQANRRPNGVQNGFKPQSANNGQAFDRFTSQDESSSGSNDDSKNPELDVQSQTSNGFSGQSEQNSGSKLSDEASPTNQFDQISTAPQGQGNNFGSSSASFSVNNGINRGQSRPFGSKNDYLPPRRQNGKPQNGRPQTRPQNYTPSQSLTDQSNQEPNNNEESTENAVPLGQQDLQTNNRPQQAVTSFGQPISNSNKLSSQNGFSSFGSQKRPTNGRRPINENNLTPTDQFGAFKPNEYLPPKKDNVNSKPTKGISQLNQQYDTDAQLNVAKDTPDKTLGSFTSSPSFETRPQQTNGFQRPQSLRPTQNGNRYQSENTFGFNSQKATVQPATELTTPLESDTDDHSIDSTFSKQPIQGRPTSPTFAAQYNNAQNSFGSQYRPRPFGQTSSSAQASVNRFDQNSQFGNQPSKQNFDSQYSPSTTRPTYAQQPQGPDDSYIYKQPSRPFGTPQGSRFPTAPSGQFNKITQSTGGQFSNLQEVPSTIVPSNSLQSSTRYPQPPTVAPNAPSSRPQGQFGSNNRGSTKYPRPPTIAPSTSFSASAQSQYQNVNGVTQASISPFPPQSPTQASQISAQSQFGSRPNNQQVQFGKPSKPTPFGKQPAQLSFSQQTSSFSQQSSSTFQTPEPTFEQQQGETDTENKQPVSSQQYTGEIYEYNKPAQTLPPPDSTPSTEQKGQGQLGQSRPQFGQTNDNKDQRPASQFEGSRPQFGAQTEAQSQDNFSGQLNEEDMKPYGALAQSMFGTQTSQQNYRPQFGQSEPQYNQIQLTGQAHDDESQDTKEPLSETPESENEPVDAEVTEPQSPKKPFGLVPACCKDNYNRKPSQSQFGVNQFGQNFGGAQQPTNAFGGQSEDFGGPREPPRFDAETGYHY